MADVCWKQGVLFEPKMPQDMPQEGNMAGESFYWNYARKVAEKELLPQKS